MQPPEIPGSSTWTRTRDLRIPTGRGSGYREADHEAITATGFTAFTGFHRPDHENCQDVFAPLWSLVAAAFLRFCLRSRR